MTSIEWLEKELRKNENIRWIGANIEDIFYKAKKIHQSEVIICWHNGYENQSPMIDEENCGQTYYTSTYGSKGSDIPELKYKDGTPIRSYDSPKIQEMVKLMNEDTSSQTLKENHIVDTNEMVKRGTLKKRMDKDGWFVVFQSNAYNESDMAYELLKSQEIDIDMYDVYKDGDEVTFEVVNKKWAKITPFLYPFKTTSSQKEISDKEIEKEIKKRYETTQNDAGFRDGVYWCLQRLKTKGV